MTAATCINPMWSIWPELVAGTPRTGRQRTRSSPGGRTRPRGPPAAWRFGVLVEQVSGAWVFEHGEEGLAVLGWGHRVVGPASVQQRLADVGFELRDLGGEGGGVDLDRLGGDVEAGVGDDLLEAA